MKIYLVRGTAGLTDRAYRRKKDAIQYADEHLLREWHKGETDDIFDGIERIELE